MRRLVFLFPGQGSQYVGMCSDLVHAFPIAKHVMDEVDNALSFSISKVMFNGHESDIKQTQNAQPAILSHSMAVVSILKQELGDIQCQLTMGHSLGEFSSLTYANSLSLKDAAQLVRLRGLAMQEAVPEGKGAMVALIGIDSSEKVIETLNVFNKNSNHENVCEIANMNAPNQLVISGHTKAVLDFSTFAKTNKLCKRAIPLPVSAPFHSSLLKPAAVKLRAAFDNVQVNLASVPIISNVTAQLMNATSKENITQSMVKQVTSPVLWSQSMNTSYNILQGDDDNPSHIHYVELGPGNVLHKLVSSNVNPNHKTHTTTVTSESVSNVSEITDFIKAFRS